MGRELAVVKVKGLRAEMASKVYSDLEEEVATGGVYI